MKRLEPDTYYILAMICILFVMNRFEYTIAEQKLQTYVILFMGIMFAIIAIVMTFRKEK